MCECDCCGRVFPAGELQGIGYVCDDCRPSWVWDYGRYLPNASPVNHEAGRACPFKAGRAPDPTLTIPNDDPRCHCTLNPAETEPGVTVVTGVSGDRGATARVALYPHCPHHGSIVRSLHRTTLSGFSLGRLRRRGPG